MKAFLSMIFFCIFATVSLACYSQTLDKHKLFYINDQKVLKVKGSPYEIGYQHGSILKKEIASNINRFIVPLSAVSSFKPPVIEEFMKAIPEIIPHIPQFLMEEMRGIADGSGFPFDKILLMNLFPEMFHCSGITVKGKATENGKLYHVRVLDYAAGNGLQDTAILLVVEPDQGHSFVNVTYAGFIGSVTGMNQSKIAVGEIGGKGYGQWNGLPMAFLLRCILQESSSLDEIKQLLTNTPRTCEFYYVFSDGKTGQSLGVYATPDYLQYIAPGALYHKTLPPVDILSNREAAFQQPEDCLIITREDNYDLLVERLMSSYGHTSVEDLQAAIKRPVAHRSNLHNAIFAPESLEMWISHAGDNKEPACDRPYTYFNLLTLLGQ